jgi:hypothetical protein
MNTVKLLSVVVLLLAISTSSAPPLRAREPAGRTVCNLPTGEAPIVSLKWLEQPQPGQVRVLDRESLTVVARNHSRGPRTFRLSFSAQGNQRHPKTKPRSLSLAPGESRNVRVSLAELGFEPRKLRTSGSLRAHVAVLPAPGTGETVALDQSLSPRIYFHGITSSQSSKRKLLVYDAAARRDRFRSGDVRNAFSESVRRDLAAVRRPELPTVLASVIDAGGGARRPDDVVFGGPGNGNHTFCVRIPFDTQDSDVGEDFFDQPGTQWAPASYARVDVTNFNFGNDSVVVGDGRLDASGCISFDHDATSDVWSVVVISQADVPRSDHPADENRFYALDSGGNVSTWYWHGEFQDPGVRYFYLDGDPRSNLFVAGTYSLRRFSDGLEDETLYAMDDACPSASDNSCNSTFLTLENESIPVAYIHPDHNDHKFAISHEMAHAVVQRYMGGHPYKSGMYTVNTGAPECIFQAGDAHALHSIEWSSAALVEGFAQFYATAVWNDTSESDGAFHYYKDDYKGGAVQDVDMADGPLGGEDAYLRNVCPGSDASKVGRGVELDWSRQLWDYRTLPGAAPTNLELLDQLSLAVNPPFFYGWSNTNSWQRMLEAIQEFDDLHGTTFLTRWDATDELNGIDY